MKQIDARGLRYTIPLIKLAAAMKLAAPGDEFEVTADYAPFEQDIRTWCASTGHTLKSVSKNGDDITAVVAKKSE